MSVLGFKVICSDAETLHILSLASSLEMKFARDWPYATPDFRLLDDAVELIDQPYNVLFFLKEEWISGPIIFNLIDKGVRAGDFSIQPRVNFACIEFYSSIESSADPVKRLSLNSFTLRSSPIDSETYLELDEVIDCRSNFNVMRQILSKQCRQMTWDGEIYLVSENNIEAMKRGSVLPPFAYLDHVVCKD